MGLTGGGRQCGSFIWGLGTSGELVWLAACAAGKENEWCLARVQGFRLHVQVSYVDGDRYHASCATKYIPSKVLGSNKALGVPIASEFRHFKY